MVLPVLPPYDEVTPFASRVISEKRGHHDGVRAFTLYYIICFRDYSWPSLLKSSKEISLWFSVTTAFSAAVIFSSKARSANCWTVSCCLRSSLSRLRLAEMQAEVLSMLELAKRALNEESNDLAAGVFAKDNLLDEINADATGILSDYIIEHPEAVHTCVDLVSVFRKLERSGDHITNIAEEIVFFIDAKVLKHRGKTDENYPEK